MLFIDAEDPDHANWTRFLNHASPDWPEGCGPNLKVRKGIEQPATGGDARAVLAFLASRDIGIGEELLFDYGRAYFEGQFGQCVGQTPSEGWQPRERSDGVSRVTGDENGT